MKITIQIQFHVEVSDNHNDIDHAVIGARLAETAAALVNDQFVDFYNGDPMPLSVDVGHAIGTVVPGLLPQV